jgi:thiol-disulfide isomerase/thioredoxin
MIKSYFKYLFLFFLFLIPVSSQAYSGPEIDFFGSPTCPHCASERDFLDEFEEDNPGITINIYDINKENSLIENLYEEYNVSQNQRGLVPITFIGDEYFLGFNEDIEGDIIDYINGIDVAEKDKYVKIPFIGEVNLLDLSLPILAMILGIADGFNVCSLGALIIILGLVMVLKSRKRILLLGGLFVLITGITYGFLMFLWHQLFTFISPYIKSMEILIAILSIAGGLYLLREFIKACKEGPTCSSGGIIAKLSPKVEKIFSTKKNIAILAGVVGIFALAITIVEFPCSAVLPMLFTGILVEAGLSTSSSLLYIGIFLLFYMLDEIIIFLIAFFTMKLKIVSPKFVIFFNLLAALIFLFLGAFYLVRIF